MPNGCRRRLIAPAIRGSPSACSIRFPAWRVTDFGLKGRLQDLRRFGRKGIFGTEYFLRAQVAELSGTITARYDIDRTFPCGRTSVSGFGQTDAVRTVAPDGQRLAAIVETVVVAEGNQPRGRNDDVHTVTIRQLVQFLFWFQPLKRKIGQHRKGLFDVQSPRQGPIFTVTRNTVNLFLYSFYISILRIESLHCLALWC